MKVRPIVAPVGSWWSREYTLDGPDDWAGWTLRAQIRDHGEAPTVLATLDAVPTGPAKAKVTMTRAMTENLGEITGVWSLCLISPSGQPQYPVGGPVLLTGRATIPA